MGLQESNERRLAAIMFTDMVGYSALVQRDEMLALELLEEHRRLLREIFPRFGGREVETTGDGFLLEFGSAIQAARCALEIQARLADRNRTTVDARQVHVRIGIHVGDVIAKDGHVLGDGVNIAARIQPLAEPDGICVSNTVYEQARNYPEFDLQAAGVPALKNIRLIEVYRLTARDQTAEPSVTPAKPRAIPAARHWKWAAAAVCGVVLVGGFLWRIQPRAPQSSERPRSGEAALQKDLSIAVIPFKMMSPEVEKDEYLSEGLTEHLTTVLSQVSGLRVPARTSAAVFKDKREDARQIGQQLHVAHILEGSVQRIGTKLRITAQLIDARGGFHLWATNYDREMQDILQVQSEVAERVVDALQIKLLPEQRGNLAKQPTSHPEAYALYLQGRHLQAQGTEAGFTNSLVLFQRAIDLQPGFAAAYAGMSDSYRGLTPNFRPPLDVMPEAKRLALRAVELDNNLSEPHVSLGLIHFYFDWDWPAAESELTTALRLNPNNAAAHRGYALLLAVRKQFADALREAELAKQLDPLAADTRGDYEFILFLNGRYDAAITHARESIKLYPHAPWSFVNLGWALAQKGEADEAVVALRQAYELDRNWSNALALAVVYAMANRETEARKLLLDVSHTAEQRYVCAYEIACGYALLNDKDQALGWLNRGLVERCDCLAMPNVEPFFENLRGDPRFQQILKTVRVPE